MLILNPDEVIIKIAVSHQFVKIAEEVSHEKHSDRDCYAHR